MAPVSRVEPILVAFFLATWIVALLAVLGLVDLRGSLDLALYPLYSLAAAAGWAAGIVYVSRSRGLPAMIRRRVWLVYFLGPPGFVYLLRAMASIEVHRAAPFVPFYSFGVFSIFFLVQVYFMPHPERRASVGSGNAERDRDGEPRWYHDRVLEHARIEAIESDLRGRGSVLIAFSGGVDSGLVAALAHRALGPRALAVTAAAETLAGRELDQARSLAREIGIAHEIVTYEELSNPEFARNPSFRCYVCQGMRMDAMIELAARRGYATVCDGTNASDPGPNRPGLKAIEERGVYSPLLAHGIDKAATRGLAHALGLSAWDRPANACLSSRIPHGQDVTLGKLRTIEAAEDLLHDRGFVVVRVRHDGGRARVEVDRRELPRLLGLWPEIEPEILALGFSDAQCDPRGYRTGGADAPPSIPA